MDIELVSIINETKLEYIGIIEKFRKPYKEEE